MKQKTTRLAKCFSKSRQKDNCGLLIPLQTTASSIALKKKHVFQRTTLNRDPHPGHQSQPSPLCLPSVALRFVGVETLTACFLTLGPTCA